MRDFLAYGVGWMVALLLPLSIYLIILMRRMRNLLVIFSVPLVLSNLFIVKSIFLTPKYALVLVLLI